MSNKIVNYFLVPGMAFTFVPALHAQEKSQQPMNVLFLMADDMRPEMGCYGVKEVKTPHLDRLGASGVVFQNAYCNVPVSGASRASMLTGVYPKYPERFIHYESSASIDSPESIPLSKWFTDQGYYTISNGKVFHNISDHASSWSEYPWRVNPEGYGRDWAEYNKWEIWMNEESGKTIHPNTMRGPFCEWADVEDTAYDDGKATLRTIADLKRLKEKDEPFFLACGFWRPHLPFNAPKKYWDLYQREDIPLADNRYRPEDLPNEVFSSKEIESYARVDTEEEAFQREAKHGYYACISYVDAQVGLILDALEDLGLAENTVVVFLGDHGWHLGEHNFWGKHNLMDRSTHVPLIVRAPGKAKGNSYSMVEFVDLYPTLCELCNLPTPPNQLDGTSFVPILEDVSAKTKEEVYIQWEGGDNAVDPHFNYAEWLKKNGKKNAMLFDHQIDPDENKNRVSDSKYKKVIQRLSNFIQTKKIEL